MSRRKSKNKTGLIGTGSVDYQKKYRIFQCLNPSCRYFFEAPEDEIVSGDYLGKEYKCEKCGFIISKELDKSEKGMNGYYEKFMEKTPQWKYCRICERLQPLEMFDKHAKMKSGRQMECKSCKWVINQKLNPLRTKEQLKEGSEGRRLLEVFRGDEKIKLNEKKIKKDFNNKCYNCRVDLANANSGEYHIDHVLPAKYLWRLSDATALLCKKCNLAKSDKWPSEFYKKDKLKDLSLRSGIPFYIMSSKKPIINPVALKQIQENMDKIYRELADRPREMKRLRDLVLKVENIDILDYLSSYSKEQILDLRAQLATRRIAPA